MSVDEKRLELADVRKRLEGERGQELWRSLDELAGTEEFDELLHREFPREAASWPEGVDRRRFLQVMGASLALGGLTACTKQPAERIVPYINQPEILVPGKRSTSRPTSSTAAMPPACWSRATWAARPRSRGTPSTRPEPEPQTFSAQASVLGLYDPDRSQVVHQRGRAKSVAGCLSSPRLMKREVEALQRLSGGVRPADSHSRP